MSLPPGVEHMKDHVLENLARHRTGLGPGTVVSPLFVAVQGPQGSGKTFLTAHLRDTLVAEPHSLSVVVLSIDDLYLPHQGLVALAQSHPENRLLKGRGQPGTHDIQLGSQILGELRAINQPGAQREVVIPQFDKSLFGGEGDRVQGGTPIRGHVDVVVLEGWCVGFYPTSVKEIEKRWKQPLEGLAVDFLNARGFRKDNVLDINERLKEYLEWWSYFDTFIQIKPVDGHPYDYIYGWRLEQEHYMKSINGGKGMTDDQIEAFVDRYIPGYVFFGRGTTEGGLGTDGQHHQPPWLGHGLQVQIGKTREILNVVKF